MRVIPTRMHGMMDYLGGLLLIASPWLFGFSDIDAARWTVIALGAVILLQSLMTDYEFGAVRQIPMSAHLTMDALAGVLLIASPWLFGFADRVWVPHVVFGIAELSAALMTEMTATRDRGLVPSTSA